MSLTLDQFTDSVCISIGDFATETKNRVRFLIPQSVQHIMGARMWECNTIRDTLTTSADDVWVDFPDKIVKPWAMYRSDYEGEIDYIPPEEYIRLLAADSTPYGEEAVVYTVMGSGLMTRKRFYFLDATTSALTIIGVFQQKIDPSAIQAVPDNFYETIKAHVIMRLTPAFVKDASGQRLPNPSYQTPYRDFVRTWGLLVSAEGPQKGKSMGYQIDDVGKDAYQYYHP